MRRRHFTESKTAQQPLYFGPRRLEPWLRRNASKLRKASRGVIGLSNLRLRLARSKTSDTSLKQWHLEEVTISHLKSRQCFVRVVTLYAKHNFAGRVSTRLTSDRPLQDG